MGLNILISSANRNVSDRVKSGKSFTYNTKSRGPRTDPCGIPDVTSCQFDSFPFTATFCLLSEMKTSIQFTILLLIFELLESFPFYYLRLPFEVHVYLVMYVILF